MAADQLADRRHSRRNPVGPAMAVVGAAIVLVLAGEVLAFGPGSEPVDVPVDVQGVLQFVVPLTVTWLLLSRRPDNRLSWLMGLTVLAYAVPTAGWGYAAHRPELPAAAAVSWATQWVGLAAVTVPLIFVPLLFPDGRLLSPRWRWVVLAGALATVCFSASTMLRSGTVEGLAGLDNPFPAPVAVVALFDVAALGLGVLAAGGALASLVVRHRHGADAERVRIRWLATFSVLLLASLLLFNLFGRVQAGTSSVLDAVTWALFSAAVPVVVAVALLVRDVAALDRLIRRTIVYGVLWLVITVLALSLPLALGLATRDLLPFWAGILAAIVLTLAVAPFRLRLIQLADRLATDLTADLAGQVAAADQRTAELAASRARIVAAADAERRRIQRDLHDGAQQELVALVAKIRLARERLPSDCTVRPTLIELQDDARRALIGLRELAQGIHPPLLTERGLVPAIEDRLVRLPMDARLDVAPGLDARRYAEEIEGVAYFVVTEALSNVLKHAHASRVDVHLAQHDGMVRVEVDDNGNGIPDGVPGGRSPTGTGLAGLADRVEAVGGQLAVRLRTGTGVGTTVAAELPARAREGGVDG